MSYPYDFQISEWTKIFSLDAVCDFYREKAERELAHRKAWFSSLTAEEQARWSMWKPREEISIGDIRPKFHDLVGPFEMAMVEQIRAERGLVRTNADAVATDAFVWALGEPADRSATKVGGLPYRPRGQPWPVVAKDDGPNPRWRKPAGQPMTFLAQFCFSGSRDLFPDLPGDVLLIFAEDEEFSRPDAVRLEWQPLGLTSLVDCADVPSPAWKFVTAYGYRHRTADYPHYGGSVEGLGDAENHVRILGATKIGGVPHLIQSTLEDENSRDPSEQFLAQLSSLITTENHHWPWINHREPWKDPTDDGRCLNLVDDGSIFLKLTADGQVTWGFECY